jgi:hypothetical protein
MKLLLSDEKTISNEDLEIRQKLYDEFNELPVTFLSKMRHLQPQVGCFNNCGFCSKSTACRSEYWSLSTLRNVICALKYSAKKYTKDDVLLAWDRHEHRVGVIFPYLNNDVALYPYLDKFVDLCYRELGVRSRISTVGFSRFNENLNRVHKNICENSLYTLAGVRLSLTQYGRVWEENGCNNSLEDYTLDLANFLSIYKPYFEKFGVGYRKMCVEIRFNPLVVNSNVLCFEYNNKFVIATGNYLFISNDENISFEETFVTDPYNHSLKLSNDGFKFIEYNLPFQADSQDLLIEYLDNNNLEEEKEVDIYLFSNRDGIYYAINPRLESNGNYGMNIYPITEARGKSGYIITERFFLNALYNFKNKKGLALRDSFINSTYDDVDEVISIIEEYAKYYEEIGKLDKSDYIRRHVLPLIKVYEKALKLAEYSSDVFFDKNFTIDTGMICNLGRAIHLFKGLTSFINEPLTPVHERNYGRHCSTMKEENCVWLLGCDYDDNIVMEKLELFNTASTKGQLSFKKVLKIEGINANINSESKYLYPGESK